MKITDLEKMLVNELMAYRLEIEPLRDTDEEEYDEAYDAWLETLHAEIETYLEDKNLL